ncbi:MAG: hypothetical protein N3D77_16255, partial [Geminicoccaceae bacterium]|nr:hypothetical protein [Geminicoccaceae bacterium]
MNEILVSQEVGMAAQEQAHVILGHPVRRKEDIRFIQGRGRYLDDIVLPRMAYMALVRSPYAHA